MVSDKGRHNLSPPAMEISALMNHDMEAAVLPRRSLSSSRTIPISPIAKTSTPPQPALKHMSHKRKRHDPKPIWAYLEHEELPPELKEKEERYLRPRAAAPQPVSESSPVAQRNGYMPVSRNKSPRPVAETELTGFERPVSDDAKVYDDVSRRVCDFIWTTAIDNELVQKAVEDPNVSLEVEARWGHIIENTSGSRLRGIHDSECVIRTNDVDVKFQSTMTMEQHRRMNMYLNTQVRKSKAPESSREVINYEHTKELDLFYELDQQGFSSLSPAVQHFIQQSGQRQRVRVTRDDKTGNFVRALVKHRIENLEISSPSTEWDYRIGINLEIRFTAPVDNLQPVIESGKTTAGSIKRLKDRMSYSWMGAYQVDLTQVIQGQTRNHELELELNAGVLLNHADKVRRNETNNFEGLINGMMNNLRVLSREMTVPAPGG